MKYLILVTLLCIPLIGGCVAQVQPNQDPILVNAERSMAAAFDTLDAFVNLEYQNQATVKAKFPEVHALAEQVRKNAPTLLVDARAATNAYKQFKSVSTANDLNGILAKIEALVQAVRPAFTKISTGG